MSRVGRYIVRAVALCIAVLASLAGAAHADEDDDDDEDAMYVGLPRWSIGLGFYGHGSRIEGRSESGWGPTLELAIGRGRWQYVVEGGLASVGMNDWTDSAYDARLDGRMLRAGVGARWLARQFRPDRSGGIELYLVSVVGGQRYAVDAMRLTRAEVGLGFGVQGRSFRRPRFAIRLEARVLFDGFAGGLGVAW